MKLFDRLGRAEGMIALAARVLSWAPPVVGTLISAAGSATATYATEKLKAYAPLSWVISGLFGALAFSFFYWLWSVARFNIAKQNLTNKYLEQVPIVNPLLDTFTSQRIDLRAFHNPYDQYLRGKNFTDCELMGPIVLYPGDRSIIANNEIFRCDFVKVRAGSRVKNAIAIQDVSITRCKIYEVTFLVTPDMVAAFDQTPGIHWITE